MIIQSQAGTGKTLVFCITILERINEESDNVQALVLAPTREIALQGQQSIANLARNSNVRTQLLIGGTSLVQNKRELRKKRPHILIGTPGRTLDLMSRGDIPGSAMQILVLDEADELLQNETFRFTFSSFLDRLKNFFRILRPYFSKFSTNNFCKTNDFLASR